MRKSGGKKLLAILFLGLMIILLLGYYHLGGFNPVLVETAAVDDYRLIGKSFKGNHRSDTVQTYFNQMRELIEEGSLPGSPVIIYDQEPEGTRGASKCFIGVLTPTSISFQDMEKRQVTAARCIRVSKDSHISVMPNPGKVEQLIQSFAAEQGYELGAFNIEIYLPDNRLVIERPIITGD